MKVGGQHVNEKKGKYRCWEAEASLLRVKRGGRMAGDPAEARHPHRGPDGCGEECECKLMLTQVQSRETCQAGSRDLEDELREARMRDTKSTLPTLLPFQLPPAVAESADLGCNRYMKRSRACRQSWGRAVLARERQSCV